MISELHTSDGETLEARWDGPERPARALVFCHPHPLDRGTMTAPLMNAVTEELAEGGWGVLRFNFRGVGASTGTHGYGNAEMDDVAAAVEAAGAALPDTPLGIAGWSFGAATALRWQAASGSTLPYVGIAPPIDSPRSPPLPAPSELAAAPRHFILGDRDQFVTVQDLQQYAVSIGAEVTVLKGSDHFFYFRESKVAEALVAALA